MFRRQLLKFYQCPQSGESSETGGCNSVSPAASTSLLPPTVVPVVFLYVNSLCLGVNAPARGAPARCAPGPWELAL